MRNKSAFFIILVITMYGFCDAAGTVFVTNDADQPETILQTPVTLSGYVKDTTGNGMENIDVVCRRDTAYTIAYTVTDANGFFEMTDIPFRKLIR